MVLAEVRLHSCYQLWLIGSLLSTCSLRLLNAQKEESRTYHMREVYMDAGLDSLCQNEKTTISFDRVERNLSGYMYSHLPYGDPYWPNKNCFLSIRAPEYYRIELRLLEFSLEGLEGKSQVSCDGDSLYIFDQESAVDDGDKIPGPGPIIAKYCGVVPNSTRLVRSSKNFLTVWWHTESKVKRSDGHTGPTGFRLMWTVFRDSNVRQENSCTAGEFFCAGPQTCIPSLLACDRVAHCTDGSDLDPKKRRQAGCSDSDEEVRSLLGTLSIAAVAGICVGAVLGCLVFWVTIFICCCDSCQKDRRRQAVPTYVA